MIRDQTASAVLLIACLLCADAVAAGPVSMPSAPQASASTERPAGGRAFRLTGTYSSAALAVLRATFEGGGAEGRSYRIGDLLPDGSMVASIECDRVVLRRDGMDRIVRLEGFDDVASEVPPAHAARPSPKASTAPPGATPRDLVAAIRASPALLMDALPVEAILDRHRMIALRLGTPEDMSVMTELKLVPGDVITAINGVELNGPNQEAWMHDYAGPPHELTLKIYRDGRTETLSY